MSITPIAPYGTIYKEGTWDIYYPQENEWGLILGITQSGFDAIVAQFAIHPNEGWDIWAHQHMNLVLSYQDRFVKGNYYKEVDEYTEAAYNAKEGKYGTYTPSYIASVNFRTTPAVYTTSYCNELYEPTKLCIAIAFLTQYPNWTDENWWGV